MVAQRKKSPKRLSKVKKNPPKQRKEKEMGPRKVGFQTGNKKQLGVTFDRAKKRRAAARRAVWADYKPPKTLFEPPKTPKIVKKPTRKRQKRVKIRKEMIEIALKEPSVRAAALKVGSKRLARRLRSKPQRIEHDLDVHERWVRAVRDTVEEVRNLPSRVRRPVSAAETLQHLRVRPCPSLASVSRILASIPHELRTRVDFSKSHYQVQRPSS